MLQTLGGSGTMKTPKLLLTLTLLAVLPSRAISHTCPPNAEVVDAPIVVVATRANGELLTPTNSVEPGETIIVRMAAFYILDSLLPIAAFEDGTFTLTIAGNSTDVTPPEGIPVIGPESCGGVLAVLSDNVQYTVSNADLAAGALDIQGAYTGGIAHFEGDWPVESTSVAALPVVSRLKIQRLTTSVVSLQFVGVPHRTYCIQATTDLKQWAEIGTVAPDSNGDCRFEHATGTASYHFYRYRQVGPP